VTPRAGVRTFATTALLATAACLPDGLVTTSEAPDPSRVQVRFLGVGGFVIRRGSDVVMTAPLYSNPSPAALLGEIGMDRNALDHFFARHALAGEMEGLRAILVGHGHYDHLMDVPYFLEKAPGARVYGSVTTRRILAGRGAETAARVTALNEPGRSLTDFTHCPDAGGDGCEVAPGQAGRWQDVAGTEGRVRVQAFCSRHPPQVLHAIRFWPGCQGRDLPRPPSRADDYPEGETLAFLVDFMENGRPVFRVYYQDAPVSRPVGWVRQDLIAERPVDLALLCTGNFDAVRRPEEVVTANLGARQVVLHHWEDFFDPSTQRRLAPIPGCDVERFRKALVRELGGDATRVHVLAPGVLRNFPRPSG
jgi:L-ascorbate metabolism protein UlaG (beta-lactamase superfamily)